MPFFDGDRLVATPKTSECPCAKVESTLSTTISFITIEMHYVDSFCPSSMAGPD